MPDKKKLRIIRGQLARMSDFMAKTPDGKNRPLYWNGAMPAYPKEYTPEEWQAKNEPIWITWACFLIRLTHDGFHTYRALGDKLPVADLLATSKEESKRCLTRKHP